MAKIIDFGAYRKSSPLSEREALEAHWLEIGGRSDIPSRDAIDPAALGDALGALLVIERIAPRQSRIRLGGERVSALLGMDLRGMPLSALFEAESHDWLGDLTETLFDRPSRVEVGVSGPRSTFRPRMAGDLLMLPLRDRQGGITRAMLHMTLPAKGPSAPARLRITGDTTRGLCAQRRPMTPADTAAFQFADKARDVVRRRESLRLVNAE